MIRNKDYFSKFYYVAFLFSNFAIVSKTLKIGLLLYLFGWHTVF